MTRTCSVLFVGLVLNACAAGDREWIPEYTGEAVALRTGSILVVKRGEEYGAVLAVDQASEERGRFIRYCWWYRHGARDFTDVGTDNGCGVTGEHDPAVRPLLQIGAIALEWSMGGDGLGWVYFGPPYGRSDEYELALARTADISQVDLSALTFYRYDPSYVVRPRSNTGQAS